MNRSRMLQIYMMFGNTVVAWKGVIFAVNCSGHDMKNATLHTFGSGHLQWHTCTAKP
jgi:hypothetical protein